MALDQYSQAEKTLQTLYLTQLSMNSWPSCSHLPLSFQAESYCSENVFLKAIMKKLSLLQKDFRIVEESQVMRNDMVCRLYKMQVKQSGEKISHKRMQQRTQLLFDKAGVNTLPWIQKQKNHALQCLLYIFFFFCFINEVIKMLVKSSGHLIL